MNRQTPETNLRQSLLQKLEDLQRAGVTHLGHASPQPPIAADSNAERASQPNDPDGDLTILAKEVAACDRCQELATSRNQTVFGVGNPHARLCFLGEAPGAEEDRQGKPFVGRAGKLLTDILEKGMGISRSDVYIFNILKCRPPGNRNPHPEESDNCRTFLDRQLAIIAPEFICCLGAVAAHNLLNTTTPIGKLRGTFHDYLGIRVVCTYHPAYLLRNPPAKKSTWEDIQLLMDAMNIEKPNIKKP